MRLFLQSIAAFLGFVFLVSPLIAWWYAHNEFIWGNGIELQLISAGDRSGDYRQLAFGPWHEGPGDCSPSTYAPVPEDSTILRYRIGHAYRLLTRMNYYEAEYSLPDGTTQINHAEGPLPLHTYRWSKLIAVIIVGLLLGAGLLRCASYLPPSTGERGKVEMK